MVEAVPQSILQTTAAILLGTLNPLNIASIVLSVAVVASKGYLISYSIHRPTFYFNIACIAADVFGLFAVTTWIAVSPPTAIAWQASPDPCISAVLWLGGISIIILCVGGLNAWLFSIFDDHIKTWRPNPPAFGEPWFDIYFVRIASWLLGVVPVTVLALSAKFTLLPVCVFGSLNPEHAQHAPFYRWLFGFLLDRSSPDRHLRLQVANTFIAQARREAGNLRRLHRQAYDKSASIRVWVKRVGWGSNVTQEREPEATEEERRQAEIAAQILQAMALEAEGGEDGARPDAVDIAGRVRQINVATGVELLVVNTGNDWTSRSEILTWLRSGGESVAMQKAGDLCAHDPRVGLLVGLASFCLGLGVLCAVFFVPVMASFVVYSCVLPCVQLLRTAGVQDDHFVLPRVLTTIYMLCLATAAVLTPAVYDFQTSLKDIVDVTNMPAAFYNSAAIRGEISRRYVAAKARASLEAVLDSKLTRNITEDIVDYAWGPERDVEANYARGILSSAPRWYEESPSDAERSAERLQLEEYGYEYGPPQSESAPGHISELARL